MVCKPVYKLTYSHTFPYLNKFICVLKVIYNQRFSIWHVHNYTSLYFVIYMLFVNKDTFLKKCIIKWLLSLQEHIEYADTKAECTHQALGLIFKSLVCCYTLRGTKKYNEELKLYIRLQLNPAYWRVKWYIKTRKYCLNVILCCNIKCTNFLMIYLNILFSWKSLF